MTHMLPWIMLNILAWCVGAKAVYDLRSEFDRQAKTWFFLDWGVRSCLVMEAAMLGMSYARGFALVSVITGIASALLMWMGFRSLQKDICYAKNLNLVRRNWDRVFNWSMLSGATLCLVGGWQFPSAADFLVRSLHPVEGAVWLAVSSWLSLRLSTSSCPSGEAQIFRPSDFSLSFAFAFLHAALIPFSRLTSIPIPPEVGALLGALFALSLVATLSVLVIRIRGFKMIEAQGELHALNEKLFGIEKLVAVGTLAAGAAHDFNNVLTGILGVTELGLREPGLPEQTRKDLEDIRSSAHAASAISAQLMGVVRQGAASAQHATLKEAVEQALSLLAKEFARRKIQVVKRIENVPPIVGDLRQVAQVCLNLILNARDAMIPKGGGVLEVSLEAMDGKVEIAVSDTGTGIPKEFQPKMFQPLQTTKGDKGTGLGLSASRVVIANMGGEINFDTEIGKGTTFRIHLPLRQEPPKSPHEAPTGESVLIVDDEEAVRKTLKRMIEALGRKAVTAENGEEALKTLSSDSDIGLVISDVHMPVMNGVELVRRLQSDFKKVRALLMTGSGAEGRDLPGVPQGLELLRKPISFEDIRRRFNGSGGV